MPWITVVKGQSFTIATNDGYPLIEKIEANENFAPLKKKLTGLGLQLFSTVNYDDGEMVISLGVEFHRDRHIFQGLTLSLNDATTDVQMQNVNLIADELKQLLTNMGLEFENKQGLIVSQFD